MGLSIRQFIHRYLRKQLAAIGLLCMILAQASAAPAALPGYRVDIKETSVSGLSSGAFMAVQFSVAYSSILKGAGVIAGGPYYCAQGNVDIATSKCSCTGIFLFSSCQVAKDSTDVKQLIGITDQRARDGAIDATGNLAHQKIWMFTGALDSVVPPPVMNDLYAYYRHYIGDAQIQFRKDVKAEHAFPTDSFGNACDKLGAPYIGNCKFDAAGELLKWIYGENIKPRSTKPLSGRLLEFDQREFVSGHRPADHGMADNGFVYVPANCDRNVNHPCKLHVAFHGCQQNVDSVDQKFIQHAGYNPWADANDIIVLYPQTKAVLGRNPNACWNWFGFDPDDPGYANKNGRQMSAVKAMIDRIAGIVPPPPPEPVCFTATNAAHVSAGRAHDWYLVARANGSNEFMGLDNIFMRTTLKRTAPDFYVIGSCS
jgi:hypothetical protein